MKEQNKSAPSFGKKTLILLILSIIAKAVGFLRSMGLAAVFGATEDTDVFYIVLSAVTFLVALADSGNRSIMPTWNKKKQEEGKKSADRYASSIIYICLMLAAFLILLFLFFGKYIARIFGSRNDALSIGFIWFFLPAILVNILIDAFEAILAANYCFYATQIKFILFNAAWIILSIFLVEKIAVYSIAIAYCIATILQLVVIVPPLLRVFRFDPKARINRKDVIETGRTAIPLSLHGQLNVISQVIDKNMASGFGAGSVTSMNYAMQIVMAISDIIMMSLGVSNSAKLSELSAKGDHKGMRDTFCLIMRGTFLVLAPLCIFCLVYHQNIIQITFGRGAFDAEAVNKTSGLFFFFVMGALPTAATTILTGSFMAIRKSRFVFYTTLIEVIINIILNFVFRFLLGLPGLALATACAAWLTFIVRMVLIEKQMPGVTKDLLNKDFAKITLAVLLSIILAFITQYLTISSSIFLSLVLQAILFFAGYFLFLLVLRQEQVSFIFLSLRNKIKR